ncbi:MAG: ActS/PrrB/RegB family redox-sensitive histidine kinase [Pseudomonadota bacterium]
MPANLEDRAGEIAVQSLRGPVRLRTLITLRWLAVVGQTATVTLVHFGFGFPTPLGLCLAAIAASAWLNIFSSLRYTPQRFLSDREATLQIAFDIVQLSALLFVTGGLANPFSALIVAPVTIAASILPLRLTALVSGLAFAAISFLGLYHFPLPWATEQAIALPVVYRAGVWAALTFSVIFFSAYANRIAAESGKMKSALAATQLVMAREERLAALGGLAAAAAHELGTPLATIQVTAKEMARDLVGQGLLEEDASLIVSQAERCRTILSRLSSRGDEGDAMLERLSVDAMLREAAGPFLDQNDGPAIIFEMIPSEPDRDDLVFRRQPEILYGLRNFIENAVDFAVSKVLLTAQWDAETISISIHDDGAGFPQEVLARLGEPYVSSRARTGARKSVGLGLGFFISKTLLERTGATIMFDNVEWRGAGASTGAWVCVTWPRTLVEPR